MLRENGASRSGRVDDWRAGDPFSHTGSRYTSRDRNKDDYDEPGQRDQESRGKSHRGDARHGGSSVRQWEARDQGHSGVSYPDDDSWTPTNRYDQLFFSSGRKLTTIGNLAEELKSGIKMAAGQLGMTARTVSNTPTAHLI